MRFVAVAAVAAALLTSCATNEPAPVEASAPPAPEASAPPAPEASAAPAPAADASSPLAAATYVQMAASGDQLEIQSSQLALTKSKNASIKSFAQTLITDHGRMSSELTAAAQAAGLTPPTTTLLPEHAQMLQQLQAAPAESFDSAFRDFQINAHQQALQLHQGYSSGGDNASLRTVAAAAVPVIQKHLNTAESLGVAPAPTPEKG